MVTIVEIGGQGDGHPEASPERGVTLDRHSDQERDSGDERQQVVQPVAAAEQDADELPGQDGRGGEP